jgi:hypothetical protein
VARLITSGIELADLQTADNKSPDGMVVGTVTSTVTARSGNRAATTATATSYREWGFVGALATSYYARAYFARTGAPSGNASIMQISSATAVVGWVNLTATGTLQLINGSTSTQIGSDSAATAGGTNLLSAGVFRVELRAKIGTGALDELELLLDGVQVAVATGLSITDTPPTRLRIGWTGDVTAATYTTLPFDDVALNDSTGGSQNTFPDDGKIIRLIPLSDNAIGAGWTEDDGLTTSLSNAVDNAPPIGIADTSAGSGGNLIRNATANASSSYDADLTAYSVWIAATATINLVVPWVCTSAPVATSAKAGLVGLASNPAITTVALGAGGTAGAFWSGVTGGTYPTGWKWSYGTVTYLPSVTLGTAPVFRITQVTSSTRIADVCAIGCYVDFTPLVLAPPDVTTARVRT